MFEPDPTWKAFTCGGSFEDFANAHPPFVFHPDVPDTIRKHLADVHALLMQSYYRYRFLDIAYVRVMQIVEMALFTRYQELGSPELVTGKMKKRVLRTPKLKDLFDWAERAGLIEETDDRPSWRKYNKRRVDVHRDLRNYAVHANPEILSGIVIVQLLYREVDFINELYDDIDVRRRRHTLERTLQQELTTVANGGAILEANGTRLIVFHAEILYASPKAEGWDLFLGCLPIFPPQPDSKGRYEVPDPILLHASTYAAEEGALRFRAGRGGDFRISPIADPTNESKCLEFSRQYDQHMILRPAVFQALADMRTQLKRFRVTPTVTSAKTRPSE